MKIKIIKFYENLKLPERKHYNDAGADIYIYNNYILEANTTIKIPLGFGLEIPDGYCGMIVPRSGHATRGIICHIPPIDSGYRGEIHAIVSNLNNYNISIEKLERIGQLIILPIIIVDFYEKLENNRNFNAFNSTGK